MCTVLFIPSFDKYFFASLRDESPTREKAVTPQIHMHQNTRFLSPKDSMAGGTWIGVNEFGNVIILLNGGFENHVKQKDYVKSRGLIVSELLVSNLPIIEWSLMDLEHIEPFTLIVWSDSNLFQLVWDGKNKQRRILDKTLPYIWSSSTLYTTEAKEKRKAIFNNWITKNPPIFKEAIFDFFTSFPDKENGFIMNRHEKVRTLSYSFIELAEFSSAEMHYNDLLHDTHSTKQLALKENCTNCLLINQ